MRVNIILEEVVFEPGLERRVKNVLCWGRGWGHTIRRNPCKTYQSRRGGEERVGRAEARNLVWKQMMKVLICQVKELGFLPLDNREPRDVFKQANNTCSSRF
jgi:hypothetical protein